MSCCGKLFRWSCLRRLGPIIDVRKILHLSDLHFGRSDPVIVGALSRIAKDLDPDLVAVSGDLTQRARVREFAAARAFLDGFKAPKVIVPGNHDVPLYNLAARFLTPLARYRRHLAPDVEPVFIDQEIVVVGVNTARSLAFKGGRINRLQIERAKAWFCDTSNDLVRILVTHHPFDMPGSDGAPDDLVGRATMALSTLSECAPDLLLAGHLHLHGIGTTAERYDLGGRHAIVVQAGTAASMRTRGAPNSFNLIHVDHAAVGIDRFEWSPVRATFKLHSTHRFVRRDAEWKPDPAFSKAR